MNAVPRLLLVPALVLAAFLALPVGALVALTPPGDVVALARDPDALAALGVSAGGGLLATAAGLLLGVPLAYVLARGRAVPGRAVVEAVLDLPVVLPHTAAGVALLFCLGRGGLGGLAGLPAVVAAMTFVSATYLVRAARDAFLSVDGEVLDAARTLGATRWQVFRRVALPLARRGIATGLVQMWARGVSDFGAVVIVAYRPKTLPVLLWERFETHGLAGAQPLGVLIVLAAVVMLGAAHAAAGSSTMRGVK